MKKLAVTLCLVAMAYGAFAQGVVKFSNGTTTLVSYEPTLGATPVPTPNAAGGFYYALLTAAPTATDPHTFAFASLYATNTTATSGGRLQGGLLSGVTVQGWAAGDTRAFEIVGWSSDNGPVFNPAWMAAGNVHTAVGDFAGPANGWFGVSSIGVGFAGGTDSNGASIPPMAIFGASPSINAGFVLVPVPEPTTMALAGLGAAAMLIFRRRK